MTDKALAKQVIEMLDNGLTKIEIRAALTSYIKNREVDVYPI